MPEINFKFQTEESSSLPALFQSLSGGEKSNNSQEVIVQQLTKLESKIMASFQEVLAAIQRNGLSIASVIDAVLSEGTEVRAFLEKLQSGENPSQKELESALKTLNNQNKEILSIRDTVLQLVPTVPSPTVPTEPEEVLPLPPLTPTTELPSSPDQIKITPSDEVGTEGSEGIDIVPAGTIPGIDSVPLNPII